MSDYRFLDDLDGLVEGTPPQLEPNHEKLKEYQDNFNYRFAKQEINYRLWRHEMFPKRRRKRK